MPDKLLLANSAKADAKAAKDAERARKRLVEGKGKVIKRNPREMATLLSVEETLVFKKLKPFLSDYIFYDDYFASDNNLIAL
jgi:hypothetical protein